MARITSHQGGANVPVNWSAGARAFAAAAALANLWMAYGSAPALVASLGVALYAGLGPLKLGQLVISRRAAEMACFLGVTVVVAIAFMKVVGGATESQSPLLSSFANLLFICGLVAVAMAVLRAAWWATARTTARVPGLWSSMRSHLRSQAGILYLYLRPREEPGD